MTTNPQNPPVTGVTARYQGPGSSNFTTTYYYWIQALYTTGWSALSVAANTGAYAPGGLFPDGFVAVQWNPAPGAIGYLVYRNTTGSTPVNAGTGIFIATAETGFKDNGNFPTFAQVPRYDGVYCARAIYNFAVDGGSHTVAIIPNLSDTIPLGALVYGGLAFGVTNLAGPTNFEIGTSAGSGAATILAATAIASINAGLIIELIGNNSQAATNKVPFQMTAAGQIQITFTVANATAGCFEVFVFYLLPSNL